MKFLYWLLLLNITSCVTSSEDYLDGQLTWKASRGSDSVGGLALHQCFSYQDKILVFGGVRDDVDHDPYNNKAFLFDRTSEQWVAIRPMLDKLAEQRLGGGEGGLLASGGVAKQMHMSRKIYLLDLQNLAWIETTHPEIDPRIRHSMVDTRSGVAIIGGTSEGEGNLNWGFYDLENQELKVFPSPRAVGTLVSHVAESICDKVLVWGGFQNNRRSSEGYIVCPENGKWEKVPPSPLSPRSNARSLSLADRKVLIWGGANSERDSNAGAIYDGTTNSWQSVPSIPDQRYSGLKNPSLTLLNENIVLLWGGRFENHEFSNDGWILDLRRLSWKRFLQKNVPEGRMHHCMLKHRESLFLFGGIGGDPSALRHFRKPYVLDLNSPKLE